MKLSWAAMAHPDHPYGYAVINKRLSMALSQAGVEILSNRAYGWDLIVNVSLPLAWLSGPEVVVHTMYELTPLPPDWVPVLNRCRAVWAPSWWVKELFTEAGVTVPIFVTGYGYDPEVYQPIDRRTVDDRLTDGRRMKYVVWARGLVSRKNALLAAKAFYLAGLPVDQAEMEIKVNDDFAEEGFKFWDDAGNIIPNIRVVTGDWTDSEMAQWMYEADCHVYLSGGEGFGLMPFEGMRTALPTICAHNTGMRDFLSPNHALLVETERMEENVGYSMRFGLQSFQHRPRLDQTIEYIRWVFEHRNEAYEMGLRAASFLEPMTWQAAGEQAKGYLCSLLSA